MENSFRYFENRECQYYPCHTGMEEMNCLFCYCPLYFLPECPGHREYVESHGRRILSCMDCDYPHRAENYSEMMRLLREAIANTGEGEMSENPEKAELTEVCGVDERGSCAGTDTELTQKEADVPDRTE